MKLILSLILSLLISFSSYAGNGVERGSVKINDNPEINNDIQEFLGNALMKCAKESQVNSFEINSVEINYERIDQGIIDTHYQLGIKHLNEKGHEVNELKIKILDSDFDNWRDYSEKLSLEIINDKNKLCN